MSALRFTQYPSRNDPNPVCFYCGKGFDGVDVHVEWNGYSKKGAFAVGVDLHTACARDLAVHLASDHLKANLRECNGT